MAREAGLMELNQIGTRLKEIRRTLDQTLAQVSKSTGVSISNLSKIENSQISPSFDIMKRICDGLGVAIEDFVARVPRAWCRDARLRRAAMRAICSPAVSMTTAPTHRSCR